VAYRLVSLALSRTILCLATQILTDAGAALHFTSEVLQPAIEAVDRGEGDDLRWYVRMRGEAKEFITLWFTLGQRTLRYESLSKLVVPLSGYEVVSLIFSFFSTCWHQ
jgi:hypothetical protein